MGWSRLLGDCREEDESMLNPLAHSSFLDMKYFE